MADTKLSEIKQRIRNDPRITEIKEFNRHRQTLEGRLERLQEHNTYHDIIMYVPGDPRSYAPLVYGYMGYWWHLKGDPKRKDYAQLLTREETAHLEFCESVENPAFKNRLGIIEMIDSKITDDVIRLKVTGVDNGKFPIFPYEEVDNLELIVVNEPYE